MLLKASRPTHYVVKERDPEISLAQCQDLSYFLTHINARTTRSVALPAPVHCELPFDAFDELDMKTYTSILLSN